MVAENEWSAEVSRQWLRQPEFVRGDTGTTVGRRFTITQQGLTVRYGLSAKEELRALVPYLAIDTLFPDQSTDRVAGLGDASVTWRRWITDRQDERAALSLGLTLPTGRPKALTRASFLDDAEAAQLGLPAAGDSRLQLGTGSAAVVAGGEYVDELSDRVTLYSNASITVPLHRNRYGYLTGVTGVVGLGAILAVGDGDLRVGAGVSAYYSASDRFYGEDLVLDDGSVLPGFLVVPNSRRFELAFRPSISHRLGSDGELRLEFTLPLFTEPFARGRKWTGQPTGARLSASWSF
jgi:hypothetical protein